MATAPPSTFARDAIEACIDRISSSRHFSRSPRLRRFLRFTIESLLGGRADEVKERTVGVEVYERASGYDPRTDPIVRTEAHRLRTRLAAYYAREGSADPIVIGYPKGSYVPELRPNTAGPADVPAGCRLVVTDFADQSPSGADAAHLGALGEGLRVRLARWPGLRVLYRASAGGGARIPAPDHLEADYRVEGSVERTGRDCVVSARLVRLADETEIWSASERGSRADEVLLERLAASIRAALTGSTILARPALAAAYDQYVKGRHSAIQYGNTFDPRDLRAAQRRLRAALEHEPEYVDALAELAHLEMLLLYPPRGDTAQILARARAFLQRALAAQPRHARSLYLLGHVEGSALRPREALRLTESAVAIDPDDPEGRTMLAARYASLGFWESAVAACDWALALDPVWEAPLRIKAYLLNRMGPVDAARLAVDELARLSKSLVDIAIARCDLRIAERDLAGARASLESPEAGLDLAPAQRDRVEIALALVRALQGGPPDARWPLQAGRRDQPRFWDHLSRLALASGDAELALELVRTSPINRSYRWLASERLVRPYLHHPGWRAFADDLHASWLRDLEEVAPRLPALPPRLPEPAQLVRDEARSPLRGNPTPHAAGPAGPGADA